MVIYILLLPVATLDSLAFFGWRRKNQQHGEEHSTQPKKKKKKRNKKKKKKKKNKKKRKQVANYGAHIIKCKRVMLHIILYLIFYLFLLQIYY
jgi:Flp pilus assembly protein TadB